MVGDTLVPCIAEEGVGTLVTLNDRKLLGPDLVFRKTKVLAYQDMHEEQYVVKFFDPLLQISTNPRQIYVTPDCNLFTSQGWRQPRELTYGYHRNAEVPTMLRALYVRCIVCSEWYLPRRPLWSFCGPKCKAYLWKGKIVGFRALNAKTVPLVVKEDWAMIQSVADITIPPGLDAVTITDVEGGDAIYANGLLLSSSQVIANRV